MTTTVEQDNSEKSENGKPEVNTDPTELEQKIIAQVEFYFGDANLPRDKFMLEQVKLDNGWIPMNVMLKFQRLSKLSSDGKVIAAAMKHSQLVEVDESGDEPKLRRSPEIPLPEFNAERRKSLMERTVYCKGFPTSAVMDDIMNVLNDHKPENILMRKYKDKLSQKYLFKGSIFTTFKTKEEAQAFLDLESVKVGDVELVRMWQVDYHASKKKERESLSEARNGQKKNKKNDASDVNTFKKNATLHLTGEISTLTREDIREAVGKFNIDPSYIGYSKGDKEAFIRLAEENSAPEALEKLGKEFKIGDSTLVVRILEGEEEEEYLKKAAEDRKQHMQRCQQAKKGKNWKRRGRNRNDADDGAPPEKKKA